MAHYYVDQQFELWSTGWFFWSQLGSPVYLRSASGQLSSSVSRIDWLLARVLEVTEPCVSHLSRA